MSPSLRRVVFFLLVAWVCAMGAEVDDDEAIEVVEFEEPAALSEEAQEDPAPEQPVEPAPEPPEALAPADRVPMPELELELETGPEPVQELEREPAVQATLEPSEPSLDGAEASSTEDSSARSALTFADRMVCGSVARVVAQTVLHPFDTLRTRAQARKRANLHPRLGVADVFLKGIVPQVLLAGPAGAVQFATLERTRDALRTRLSSRISSDLLGSAAGAFAAAFIRVPQEVLKQPVQAGLYPHSAACTSAVLRQGPGRLYRGFWATVLRDIPWNSLGYTIWQLLKVLTRAPQTAAADAALGFTGGALAAVVLTPMDVAKTRLMTQSAGDAVQYTGTLATVVRVARDEGVPALFRGVLPRVLYLAPLASLVYTVYEKVARLLLEAKARRAAAREEL